MPSMKILLIAGGWSSEREVSLTGARGMQEALLKRGHAVTFFDLLENFDELLETARQHDFALINLHGSPGEDGLVQAMLEKAGIDWKNEPLNTWDDFYAQCEKVKAAGIDATHSWSTGHFTCPAGILACDAPSLTIGHENGKTTVKPEQCVRAFETMLTMEKYSNGTTYGSQAATEAFKTGALGFLCAGPWTEPDYQQAGVHYDIQLIPAYEKDGWTGGCQGQDWMYGVDSKDAGRNDAIRRWLKKMGSFETQKAFTKVIGRSTLRQDVMNDPEALTLDVAKVLSRGLNAGMPQMEFGHSSVFWVSAIADVAPRVTSGELTPQQGAEEFIKAVNALYTEAGE